MDIFTIKSEGKNTGYCIARNPDADVGPLSVIDRSGKRIGSVSDFINFPPNVKKPDIKKDESKPNLSQVSVYSSDGEFAVGFLKNILQFFYFGSLSASVKWDSSTIAQMTFNNVLSDSVSSEGLSSPVQIAKYIQQGSITDEKMVLDFIDKKRESFLVFDIIKSNSFTITFNKGRAAKSRTLINYLKNTASVKGTAKIEENNDFTLTYSQDKPLTVGTQQYDFWIERTLFGIDLITGPHGQSFDSAESISKKPLDQGVDARLSPHSRKEMIPSRSIQIPSLSSVKPEYLTPVRIDPDMAYLKNI